jgi:uncharacterized lipoprotein YddW (UPF0748 family)
MGRFGKAVWLHSMPKTKQECDTVVNRVADAGFDLLVACVKFMDGKVEYPSRIARIKEGFEEFDPLEETCRLCRKRGVKTHAWAAFEKEFGEPIEHMVGSPREHPVYVPALDWRCEPVTQFVRDLHKETSSRKMELSAAVFHSWPIPLNSQGQDWWRWSEEKIVDYLFPMNYTAPPRNCVSWALTHRQIVKPPVQLWEGIFRFKWATTEQYMELNRLMRDDVGADGIVAFQYSTLTDEDCAAMAKF